MNFTVDEQFINDTKADQKFYHKGDTIVKESETCNCFLYLVSGELGVYNLTEEGKEFLQHKVFAGNFFGEPAVLLGKPFPGSVEVSSEKAEVLKISRQNFIEYLKKNPENFLAFTMSIAEKSINKSMNLKNLIFLGPEERILKQLKDHKNSMKANGERVLISLTRKELSNMTGLRIETVIRAVKKMEKDKLLEIKSGKIYF